MTVAATNTREIDIGTLIRRAAQLAGIMAFEQTASGGQWDARAAFGRDQLELIIDRLPMRGVFVRDVEFYTLTLPSLATFGGADDPIVLPADTIDVIQTAMYRESSDTAEQQVRPVDRETWQTSLDKDVTAPPTRYYVHKTGEVKLYLLPVPNVGGATLRVQRKRLLADTEANDDTVDLERYWLDHLQFELAWRFSAAAGLPMDQRADLKNEAVQSREMALSAARSGVPFTIELDHKTGW